MRRTFFLAPRFVAWGDIRIDRGTEGLRTITITDTITERYGKELQNISNELERSHLEVFLDSAGGDVSAAMQIGRLIRNYEGWTIIPEVSKCYSSCALIFVAGVRRFGAGEIGLHRPYLASTPQSRTFLETQVPFMLAQIKNYVNEMGVTEDFYHQMVNTAPSEMRTYSALELRRLVPMIDPLYEEIQISYDARRHGITTADMRQRKRDAERCHQRPSQYATCADAIMWGLSERVYRERYESAKVCVWPETMKAVPTRQRRDHPHYVRWETCIRKIMLAR